MDVRLPNGKVIRGVPEGTPKDVIAQKAIQAGLAQPSDFPAIDTYTTQAQSESSLENFLAGMGGAMYGMGLGVKQRLGLAEQPEIDEHRKSMEGLRSTTGGTVGEFAGVAAPVAATAAIPGANTLTGAAAVGALTGAVQPAIEGESPAVNTAVGAAGGLGGQYLGGKVAQFAGQKLAAAKDSRALERARQAVRDRTLTEGQGAGYRFTPSQAGKASYKEGISGKYKTQQAMGIENQRVTDRLVRQGLGLDEAAELTPETLASVRRAAYETGYVPAKAAGVVKVDPRYANDIDSIAKPFRDAVTDFPDAVPSETAAILKQLDGLKVSQFDAANGIAKVQNLRDQAGVAYRSGDTAGGRALRKAADTIERQIERTLPPGETLDQFRAARQLIAKTHSVEEALNPATGQVDAKKLGAQFKKGKPLSGELRTVGKVAAGFPDTMAVPKQGDAAPFTVFDMMHGTGLAGLGAGFSDRPIMATLGLLPSLARYGARKSLMSPATQKGLAPKYQVPASTRALAGLLDNPLTSAAIRGAAPAGLLQYR